MAVGVITAVFRHSTTRGSARLVLLALADVAADTGDVTAYRRSQAELARKANLDPKTIPRAIDAILEAGELVLLDSDGNEYSTREASARGRGSTDYRILLPGLEERDPAGRGDRRTRGQTPQVGGSDPAGSGGQTPQDAGSVIPSLPLGTPSPSKPATRKVLLPEGWQPSTELRAWATADHPAVDVDRELLKFTDHWRSKAERRADWDATFRNWIRKAAEILTTSPTRRRPPPAPLAPRRATTTDPTAGVLKL